MRKTTIKASVLSAMLTVLLFGLHSEAAQRKATPLVSTALKGHAFEIRASRSGLPSTTRIETELPALYYAGKSKDGRLLAYTTLAQYNQFAPRGHQEITSTGLAVRSDVRLVPTGDLLIEDTSTGAHWQVNSPDQYVVAAAWSPTNPNTIAFTYSTGAAYGLAIANATTKMTTTIRDGGVVPDYIGWSSSGKTLSFFNEHEGDLGDEDIEMGTILEEGRAVLDKELAGEEQWANQLPALEKSVEMRRPRTFHFKMSDGSLFKGDNLLGSTSIDLYSPSGMRIGSARADTVIGVLPEGLVYKSFDGDRARVHFMDRRGNVITLLDSAVVTYRLPFFAFTSPTLTVTQTGDGYSPNCGVWDHTLAKGMGYAYDMQARSGSEYIEASGSGTVAYLLETVTCNSLDSGSDGSICADYSSSCSSNSGFGNTIILQHSDGTWTKYTHLKANSIAPTAVGQSVMAGCQIAYQGHTGATKGNLPNGCGDHLHFQRQSSGALGGTSISIAFSDTSNPLTCTTYTSGNTGMSCLFQ
jgi:hypothetical protein